MKSLLSTKIKNYRNELGLSQEALAGKLGVTAQAVSKWECAQAYPDIELLPELAEIFQVSIDSLLRDEDTGAGSRVQEEAGTGTDTLLGDPQFPHDDVLRVVQVLNGRVVSAQDSKQEICLNVEGLRNLKMKNIHIEVWGSVTTANDIIGNINANGYVECNNIDGDVAAGDYVECNNIDGDVSAGDYVECNAVDGNVAAHDYVECGDVGGSIDAGGYVECGDVGGCVRGL